MKTKFKKEILIAEVVPKKTGKDNYYIEIIQNKPKGIIKTITRLHISKYIKRAMKPRPNKQKLGRSR